MARLLRYIHPHVSRYAQVDVPCRQTIIRRNRVELFLTVTLNNEENIMRPNWILLITTMLTIWIQASSSAWGQVEKVTAFVNVNLVPMTDETIIPEQTVLTKGMRITAIGPSKAIDIPDNSIVIDGSNFYLIPGLADMHIHNDTRWLNGGWPVSPFNLFLTNGVTTIRDIYG